MYMSVGVMKDYKLKLRKLRASHSSQLSLIFFHDCSESGTVSGLSWKVTEHVVTYITSLVCYPNILSVAFRGFSPSRGPRCAEIL